MKTLRHLFLFSLLCASIAPAAACTPLPVVADQDTLAARPAPFGGLSRAVAGMMAWFSPERSTGMTADAAVQVSGRLLAKGSHRNEVVRALDEEGRCIARTTTDLTGRFRLELPRDARVQLHFSKPDHLEKVVKVDTHHAVAGKRARRLNRNVRFDVVLVPGTELPDMGYDGPVGTITFVRGSGLMKVHHHERLLPLSADR